MLCFFSLETDWTVLPIARSSRFKLDVLFTSIKEIFWDWKKSAKEPSTGIASFKSNRGLFKAERVALPLNRSSRELHIIVPWEFKIPIASYSKEVLQPPTLFSALCNPSAAVQCHAMRTNFYIPGIQGLGEIWMHAPPSLRENFYCVP